MRTSWLRVFISFISLLGILGCSSVPAKNIQRKEPSKKETCDLKINANSNVFEFYRDRIHVALEVVRDRPDLEVKDLSFIHLKSLSKESMEKFSMAFGSQEIAVTHRRISDFIGPELPISIAYNQEVSNFRNQNGWAKKRTPALRRSIIAILGALNSGRVLTLCHESLPELKMVFVPMNFSNYRYFTLDSNGIYSDLTYPQVCQAVGDLGRLKSRALLGFLQVASGQDFGIPLGQLSSAERRLIVDLLGIALAEEFRARFDPPRRIRKNKGVDSLDMFKTAILMLSPTNVSVEQCSYWGLNFIGSRKERSAAALGFMQGRTLGTADAFLEELAISLRQGREWTADDLRRIQGLLGWI